MTWAWGGAIAAVVVVGCGNPNRAELAANRQFDCRDRSASYVVVGSLVANELGVQLDCRDAGPRLLRWTVDRDGTRDEQTFSLGVREFDRLWDKIDGSGWHYLRDCDGTGGAADPIYNFDVTDWNGTGSYACQTAGELPFPYNVVVDQLDLAAAEHAPAAGSNRKADDDP
ncbi:MAG: hypothetical protein R3B06_17310 [Kofleriaceae bacterium]